MMANRRKIAKQLAECLFWMASGCFLIAGMYLYDADGDIWKETLILAPVITVAVLIHWNRSRKKPEYMKKVLGVQVDSKRKQEYDWLRILAVSMVIVTHAIQRDIEDGIITDDRACYILTIVYVFCLACNLIYVMLSGGLLMPYREEKLSDFYLNRVSRVVLPMSVYFVFHLWIKQKLEYGGLLGAVGGVLSSLFRGDTSAAPHYWLMYVILSIYVVVPFFRYMFKDMPYKILTSMVAVSWIFMFFTTYSPIPCAVNPIMASWIGVSVFGYWIMREETRRYDKIILLSGVVGLGITIYCIKTSENFREICCNCSPTMMMIAGSLFSLVFMFPQIFSKGNVVLNILGKYSYSLILIHWVVLGGIIRKTFHIYTNQYYYVGGILLSLAATLAVSFVVAFLIDNMVLVVVEQIYDSVVKYSRLFWKKFLQE